jgi:hypothetical protein
MVIMVAMGGFETRPYTPPPHFPQPAPRHGKSRSDDTLLTVCFSLREKRRDKARRQLFIALQRKKRLLAIALTGNRQ